MYAVLSVLGEDRTGIIAAVTGCLYDAGANLEDVSMTVLEGELAMMLYVNLPTMKSMRLSRQSLDKLARAWRLTCHWTPMTPGRSNRKSLGLRTKTHVITAIGRDRAGIVYEISKIMAKNRINISGLDSRYIKSKKNRGADLYAMMLEVEIPERCALPNVRTALSRAGARLGFDIQIKSSEKIEF